MKLRIPRKKKKALKKKLGFTIYFEVTLKDGETLFKRYGTLPTNLPKKRFKFLVIVPAVFHMSMFNPGEFVSCRILRIEDAVTKRIFLHLDKRNRQWQEKNL